MEELIDGSVSGNAVTTMGDGDIWFPNLGLYLHDVPQSFTVFGFRIALYGVIIGIGIICAFLLMSKSCKKMNVPEDDIYDMGIWLILFGVIGARLYYVIFMWDYYKNNLASIFNIRQGGLAIYGGVIAGLIAEIIYCKVKKKNMFKLGDIAFQGVLVGQIMGRYGNFTNREVFGTYTNNLFAMRLPVSAVNHEYIDEAISSHMEEGSNYIQVHPTFFYESAYNFILLILIFIFQKKKAFDGEVMLWYAGGYGIGRCIIEGIRTDRLYIHGTHLAVSQLLGFGLFVFAVIADIVVRYKLKGNNKIEDKIEDKNENKLENK